MFADALTDPAQLRDHYRTPSETVRGKVIGQLDEQCRNFIGRSTFVLVGTSSASGHQDVSPKGGPAGFVKILDEHHLAIPDLNGNNLLDSLHNIIDTGQVGLLFVVAGLGETLRVNGEAAVTRDPAVLDLFADELRRPRTAIGVTVREAYIHCAKAFRRGGLWQPETWPSAADRPSAAAALISHAGLDGVTEREVQSALEHSYTRDLAADLPVRGD